MSAAIGYPFQIYAKDKPSQVKICNFMNQAAFAEMDKDPHMTSVHVTPVDGRPVPMTALVQVSPFAAAFSSRYMGGLKGRVQDAIRDAEAAAKKAAMRMTP